MQGKHARDKVEGEGGIRPPKLSDAPEKEVTPWKNGGNKQDIWVDMINADSEMNVSRLHLIAEFEPTLDI